MRSSQAFPSLKGDIAPKTDARTERSNRQFTGNLARDWHEHSQADIRSNLLTLNPRIAICDEEVRIAISPSGLLAFLKGSRLPGASDNEWSIELVVMVRLRRSGTGAKLHIEGSGRSPDPALVSLIIKTHHLSRQLLDSNETSLAATAEAAGHSGSWFTRMVRLTWLAPDIAKAILEGHQPPELTARQLMLDTRLPLDWDEKRVKLGFAS